MLNNAGIMHVSYVLILYSVAFIVFLCKLPLTTSCEHSLTFTVVNVLLHIYAVHAWPNSDSTDQDGPKYTSINRNGNANGNANGHARSTSQQIQDAEAYELHGLVSDDEEDLPTGPRRNSDEELGK